MDGVGMSVNGRREKQQEQQRHEHVNASHWIQILYLHEYLVVCCGQFGKKRSSRLAFLVESEGKLWTYLLVRMREEYFFQGSHRSSKEVKPYSIERFSE